VLGPATGLRPADLAALAVLCLLLVISVCGRLYAYCLLEPALEPTTIVAANADHFLPRAEGTRRAVPIGACAGPVMIEFVEPISHGRDTLPVAPPDQGDRVFYVYQGWILHDPNVAMKLSALHVLRRAMGLVGLVAAGERDKLAMKVIVPAGCSASPNAVVAALPGKARP